MLEIEAWNWIIILSMESKTWSLRLKFKVCQQSAQEVKILMAAAKDSWTCLDIFYLKTHGSYSSLWSLKIVLWKVYLVSELHVNGLYKIALYFIVILLAMLLGGPLRFTIEKSDVSFVRFITRQTICQGKLTLISHVSFFLSKIWLSMLLNWQDFCVN